MIVAGLNRRLKELDTLQKKMKKASDALSWRIGEDTIRTQQKADEAKVQGALAHFEAHDRPLAVILALTGKAVGAV